MGFFAKKSVVAAAISTVVVWVCVGTIVFHWLEDWTWIQALYFTVVTLTTIGYGDLHPTRDLTRLVDVIFILVALGAVVGSITILGTSRVEKRHQRAAGKEPTP